VAFWSDLVEFEIVPVVPSAQTREAVEPLLEQRAAGAATATSA
jgi:hypothetical protein